MFAMYASVGELSVLGVRSSWNQAILGLEPIPSLSDARFVRYWLEHLRPNLIALTRSNTQDNLNAELVGNLPFPTLSAVAQSRIADYLDRETAHIDMLIQKKARLSSLLSEAGQRRLLDSVGDWRSADTWSLRQAGADVVTGPFGTQLAASEYIDGGVPVVNPTHITSTGKIRPDRWISVPEDVANRLARHRVAAGDILLARKGDVGRSAVVSADQGGWLCGSDSIAVRTRKSTLRPHFLVLVLQIDLYRQQLEARSTGVMMANLNESTLLSFRLPRLSIMRQDEVVTQMTAALREVRRLVARLSESVKLLKERRHALITAAVTGELDIPEAA